MVKKEKKEKVKEIVKDLLAAKVVAIVNLEKLPNRLLQSIRNNLRDHSKLIISKRNLLRKALVLSGKDKLLDHIKGQKAILISNLDPIQLYREACSNPMEAYAKPGQIALDDITVPAGETTLPPGPVLSELKQAGIDARIQSGKIAVGKDSTVVKKGEEITETISKALQKLDIKPFEINVNIPVILEGGLLFTDEILSIDEERFSKMLKNSLSNYYYLSIELGMPTKDNINSLLQKAYRNSFILSIERNIIYPETAEEIIKKAELAKRRIEKEMDGERKEG